MPKEQLRPLVDCNKTMGPTNSGEEKLGSSPNPDEGGNNVREEQASRNAAEDRLLALQLAAQRQQQLGESSLTGGLTGNSSALRAPDQSYFQQAATAAPGDLGAALAAYAGSNHATSSRSHSLPHLLAASQHQTAFAPGALTQSERAFSGLAGAALGGRQLPGGGTELDNERMLQLLTNAPAPPTGLTHTELDPYRLAAQRQQLSTLAAASLGLSPGGAGTSGDPAAAYRQAAWLANLQNADTLLAAQQQQAFPPGHSLFLGGLTGHQHPAFNPTALQQAQQRAALAANLGLNIDGRVPNTLISSLGASPGQTAPGPQDVAASSPGLDTSMASSSAGGTAGVPAAAAVAPAAGRRPRPQGDVFKPPRTKRMYRHESFPERLYRILNDAERDGKEDVVGWINDGKAFQVHHPERFESEILRNYFRHQKFSSFQRQLGLYGFTRIKEGRGRGGSEHPLFRKEWPDRLKSIQRTDYP